MELLAKVLLIGSLSTLAIFSFAIFVTLVAVTIRDWVIQFHKRKRSKRWN